MHTFGIGESYPIPQGQFRAIPEYQVVLLVKEQAYPSKVYNVPSEHENKNLKCIHFPNYMHMNELVVYNVP